MPLRKELEGQTNEGSGISRETHEVHISFERDSFDESTQRIVHNLEIAYTWAIQIVRSVRISILQSADDSVGMG
jgi:hypothetical protein